MDRFKREETLFRLGPKHNHIIFAKLLENDQSVENAQEMAMKEQRYLWKTGHKWNKSHYVIDIRNSISNEDDSHIENYNQEQLNIVIQNEENELKVSEPSSSSNSNEHSNTQITISNAHDSNNEGVNEYKSTNLHPQYMTEKHDTKQIHYTSLISIDEQKNDMNNYKEHKSPKNKAADCIINDDTVLQCVSVQRLTNCMNQCNEYLKDTNEDALTTIDTQLIVNDFLHLVMYHDSDKAFQKIEKEVIDCDIAKCKIVPRYYVDRQKTNDILDIKFQILDKIHVYYKHAYDMGDRFGKKEKETLLANVQKNNTSKNHFYKHTEGSLANVKMVECQKIIHQKQQMYNHLGINNRITDRFRNQMFSSKKIKRSNKTYIFGCEYRYYGTGEEAMEKKDEQYNSMVIRQKYLCLKNEIIDNPVYNLSKKHFQSVYNKAQLHYKSEQRRKHFPQLTSQHVLALMLYCNFTILQHEFSKTYRDSCGYFHQEYFHFGKYLKEAVHEYGTKIDDSNIKEFYHGVGEKLVPSDLLGESGMGVRIFGPLSTSSEIVQALKFTHNRNGLVLKFTGSRTTFLNVSPFSDFTHEKECLFIQNQDILKIVNIIDAKTMCEYTDVIESLQVIDQILSEPFSEMIRKIAESRKGTIKRLIHDRLSTELPHKNYHKWSELQQYGRDLVNTYFQNKTSLKLNYAIINDYSFMSQILLHTGGIKLDVINALYTNVEYIEIKNIELFSTMKNILEFFDTCQETDIPQIVIKASNISESNVCQQINLNYAKLFAQQNAEIKCDKNRKTVSIKPMKMKEAHQENTTTEYTMILQVDDRKCWRKMVDKCWTFCENPVVCLCFQIITTLLEITGTVWALLSFGANDCNFLKTFIIVFMCRNLFTSYLYYLTFANKRNVDKLAAMIHYVCIVIGFMILFMVDCKKTKFWSYCFNLMVILALKESARLLLDVLVPLLVVVVCSPFFLCQFFCCTD